MISLFRSMDKEFKPKKKDSFFKYYGQNGIYTISSCHVNEFLKHEKNSNSDLIEVHNRPIYIKYLTFYELLF